MLPPATIALRPGPAAAVKVAGSESSPRYSLPVLPSQQAPGTGVQLQRSKPYLLSRRERMRNRNSVRYAARRDEYYARHGGGDGDGGGRDSYDDVRSEVLDVLRPGAERKMSLEDVAKEAWYDVVENSAAGRVVQEDEDDEMTPVGRIETPLEYRARQAAALHDLLGLVLGEETPVGGKRKKVDDEMDAVFEEERELAARGFMKVSAEEYLSEVGTVRWIAFES